MKKYNLTPQEEETFCVCSCLQAIFRAEGTEMSQREISQKLTSLKEGFAMNDKRARKFLGKIGLDIIYFNYNSTPFNEPDITLKEMANRKNHGIIGAKFHASLLLEFKDPGLTLLDPKNCTIQETNLYSVIRYMNQFNSGGFGLIRRL
ncbi:MAG: hypothetical protein KKF68_02460 [Nanoarchaeota archaeon]|nr:hypothetical protein [Nanoarchaeota archaeon]